MSKPVQDSLHALQQAKRTINKLLTGTEHVHQLLEINSQFRRIETRLQFMGAVTEPELAQNKSKDQFPPITNFMGEKIVRAKRISSDDLNPDETKREKFREKVNRLYGHILDLTADIVLNSYTLPEDQLVLRGVAKLAGVADFETKDLNEAFVSEIKKGIRRQAEEDELALKIKEEAEKLSGGSSGPPEPKVIKVTKAEIQASDYLKKHGVKPGDEVTQLADGKYELKPRD